MLVNWNQLTPRRLLRCASICAVSLAVANLTSAAGEEIIFTIDPAQSTQTWNGTVHYLGLGDYLPQSPGSLSAPVSGHFLASFDPFSGAPTQLQLIGGHGYWDVAMPHLGVGGAGGSGTPAPANFAGRTAGGEIHFAVRDLVYDFDSPQLTGSGGAFTAGTTSFTVISGGMDNEVYYGQEFGSYVGSSDEMDGGTWTLTEAPAGSGNWQLAFASSYSFELGTDVDSWITTVNAVATAQFSAANVGSIDPGGTTTEALGGSSTTGGVSANFSEPIAGGGTLSVQQLEDVTGLSQAAVAAAEINPVFALSTETLAANPQIWNVDFSGDLAGGTVELVFAYDESLLPLGLNELELGIWHFNSNTNDWEFGGTVDPLANTVTYLTDNFSPFQLGVVPEPSTLALACIGLLGLAAFVRRRRTDAANLHLS